MECIINITCIINILDEYEINVFYSTQYLFVIGNITYLKTLLWYLLYEA